MAKIEIKPTDKGHGVYVDGSYFGSFKSPRKARDYAKLITGQGKIDLHADMLSSEARAEHARFRRQ